MKNEEEIWELVDKKKDNFVEFSDRIFDAPEILYKEFKSVSEHTKMLKKEGFKITECICNMPTAVMGEYGDSGPVIALLGEFDALPGLSQKAGIAEHKPIENSGNGHGCGHNLLGAASLLAATAIKDWLEKNNIKARVRYYGCPAEEGGAAKTYMARDGWFNNVDTAICWHPATFNSVNKPVSLANTRVDFTFTGRAAHAATAPHLGRSALDAIELMNIGVNYMREHMPDASRVHYAYMDAGGNAANVVQAKATIRHLIRASNSMELRALVDRVYKIADGAALMTETSVEKNVYSGVSNLLGNEPLEDLMQDEFEKLGPVIFDQGDKDFANKIRSTLNESDILDSFQRIGMKAPLDMPLCDFVASLNNESNGGIGSTDVGDVSWVVPTVQARVATCAVGTPFHTWQTVAQGKAPAAHKGMIHAAKIMAATASSLIKNPEKLNKAKKAHKSQIKENPYICPIPNGVMPPIEWE
ncbi:M20 family metallopeptidase [Alphaproteobacteria bacterium]|nr:M20 family metallopeptidase [Alphaproteobacteria bacterium]